MSDYKQSDELSKEKLASLYGLLQTIKYEQANELTKTDNVVGVSAFVDDDNKNEQFELLDYLAAEGAITGLDTDEMVEFKDFNFYNKQLLTILIQINEPVFSNLHATARRLVEPTEYNNLSDEVSADKTKITAGKAHLTLVNDVMKVSLPGLGEITFCTYRPDKAPYILVSYIFELYTAKPDTAFSVTDMDNLEGCNYDSLAEGLRSCGFDKTVKQIFFIRKGRFYTFHPEADITKDQALGIFICAQNNVKKRKKPEVRV